MQETWVQSLSQEDSPGERKGNPLQYSCLGNPMDRGAWWATVHGVAKSWTQLSDQAFARTEKSKTCGKWIDIIIAITEFKLICFVVPRFFKINIY